MSLGTGLVNDVAVSNVLTGIKNKDVMYTKYWLDRKHPDFRRPFLPRIDADDFLTHSRILAEETHKHTLEIKMHAMRMRVSEETVRAQATKTTAFMQRWKNAIVQADEERARVLFEKWKADASPEKTES